MIEFEQFELKNGLKVIVHEEPEVEQAVVNILYDVGSRDEKEEQTGFAHLFEHLMFGGSNNISSYDRELQRVGGENNAFTSPDITNYYLTLPANNLETAFWLESDRMASLSFDPKVLEVQQNVVVEEFKQRYLNQPYGDIWLKLRPLAYKQHPYRWATIGKEISHIVDATLDDVKNFFYSYYLPSNATMVVAGKVKAKQVEKLAEKWFADIPAGNRPQRKLSEEPRQNERRILEVEANVPQDALYKVYHMPGRFEETYHSADLVSDILGRGNSSRLHLKLVKQTPVFSSLSAHVMGSIEPGLLVVSGKLSPGYSLPDGEEAVDQVIQNLLDNGIEDGELQKVKNQAESTVVFSEVDILNRAMNLAFGSLSGNPEWINLEIEKIRSVSASSILNSAKEILRDSNASVLYYKKQTK